MRNNSGNEGGLKMKTSEYTMEITTVMHGTPTAKCLEKIISKATGDIVTVKKKD